MSEKKKKTIKERFRGFISDYKREATNLEEAKRKTRARMIVAGVILSVLLLVFCFIHIIVYLILEVIALGIMAITWFKATKRNNMNFCSACGEKFDYEKNVEWQTSGYEQKTCSIPNNPTSNTVIKKEFANVIITCHCGKCGEVKRFDEKFEVCRWFYGGGKQESDLHILLNNYFKI